MAEGYTPVNQHSHRKSTILMVLARKKYIFSWAMLVSGRVLLRVFSFWPGLRSPTATKSNAAVVRAMGYDAVGGIVEKADCFSKGCHSLRSKRGRSGPRMC